MMDLSKICRMCSTEDGPLRSIFHDYYELRLTEIISDVLRLEISAADGLPANICNPCVGILTKMRHLIDQFRENERALRQRIFGIDVRCGDEAFAFDAIKAELVFNEALIPRIETCAVSQEDGPLSVAVLLKQGSFEEKDVLESSSDDDADSERTANNIGSEESESTLGIIRKHGQERRPFLHDPSRPKLNDYKCYICKSESMGSAKALLDHLSVHSELVPQTCPDCVTEVIVLRDIRSLNVHRKMHAQPIKCEYCDRRYGDFYARDEHVKVYHLGEGAPCPSTCQQCSKVCKSVAALKSHMRNHKLDVRCDHCGKIFHKMHKLREHVTRVHEQAERHQCNICNKVLHSLGSYNSHLKMHNAEKNYCCDLCPLKFYTSANLRTHKRVHQKNVNYKPKKDWTSHYTVSYTADGAKHFTCNLCGKTATGIINTIISHVRLHFKEVQCDQCDLKFTFVNQLKAHYVVHTRERNFKCNYCEKDFMYDSHMRHHIKQAHPAEREAERAAAGRKRAATQTNGRYTS